MTGERIAKYQLIHTENPDVCLQSFVILNSATLLTSNQLAEHEDEQTVTQNCASCPALRDGTLAHAWVSEVRDF